MDVQELCCKTGAQSVGSNKVIIDYLNRSYLATLTNGKISLRRGDDEVPLKSKTLILRYLTLAKGTPATNRLITLKRLP